MTTDTIIERLTSIISDLEFPDSSGRAEDGLWALRDELRAEQGANAERLKFLMDGQPETLIDLISELFSDSAAISSTLFCLCMDSRFQGIKHADLFNLIAEALRQKLIQKHP